MASWNGAVATRDEIREAKRRAILMAAARLFNHAGYHATSLDQVAADLGVTKPTIYYYFQNKEALLYECLLVSHQCGKDAMRESDELDGTALERMSHLYRTFCRLLLERGGAFASRSALQALPAEQQSELMGNRRRFDAYNQRLIGEAIEEGGLRPINVRLASNFYLGAITWALRWYSEDDACTPQEVSETFLDIFLNGVADRDPS